MDNDGKVHQIPGKPNQILGLIERAKREMDQEMEIKKLTAKIQRIKYNALIAEGFSVDQSMDILKTEILAGKL